MAKETKDKKTPPKKPVQKRHGNKGKKVIVRKIRGLDLKDAKGKKEVISGGAMIAVGKIAGRQIPLVDSNLVSGGVIGGLAIYSKNQVALGGSISDLMDYAIEKWGHKIPGMGWYSSSPNALGTPRAQASMGLYAPGASMDRQIRAIPQTASFTY